MGRRSKRVPSSKTDQSSGKGPSLPSRSKPVQNKEIIDAEERKLRREKKLRMKEKKKLREKEKKEGRSSERQHSNDPEDDTESEQISLDFQEEPLVMESQHEEGISEDSPLYDEEATLLKPVTYGRIKKDPEDKEEFDSLIQRIETRCVTGVQIMLDDEYLDIFEISGVLSGRRPIRAGPVLQVKSIAISNKEKTWNDFEMYGEISVTDYKKNTFYFYKCEEDDPELVSSRWNLYFTHCPIAPVMGGKVKFNLTNKDSMVQIFNGEYDLDCSSKDDYKEDMADKFPGKDGYRATMVFTKIPFVVLAKVVMFLRYTPPGCGDRTYGVYGNITVNGVVCFERIWSDPLDMKCGVSDGFDQPRYVFAVPAGLPLDVKFDLHYGNCEFASGTYEVKPCNYYSEDPLIWKIRKGENFCFGMEVHWIYHEDFFYKDGWWSRELNVKWSPDIQIDEPLTAVSLVEVFSVVLYGGGDSAPFPDLCGIIVVRNRDESMSGDGLKKVYIFARNKDCPDKFSSNEQQFSTVSLAWPDWWVLEKHFFMYWKLEDVDDNLVCKGRLRSDDCISRRDRRICDVIEGENGYFAAVHYSVFKNGKKAKVTVKCNKKDGLYSLVYGSVFAAYDNNDDYPSTYEKECYRSIIFKRSKEDCVKVENGSQIPLSKSHVSAPSDCKKLIVDVDLWVRPYMTSSPYRLEKYELTFSPGTGCQGDGRILVDVVWSQ